MKKRGAVYSIIFLTFILFTGCQKEQEEKPVILRNEDKSVTYVTINPVYEDLVFEESLDCRYTQTKKYELSFGMTGIPIESIDVKRGDMVKKGQLLASLELGDTREELSELEHLLKVKQLKLQQINELKNKDLSIAKYVYQRTSNIYQYEDRQEEIEREYVKEIESMEHEVILYQEKVNALKEEISKGTIYAPVTGEITYALVAEEKSYSKKDREVATVSDISKCYFQSASIDYKENFKNYFREDEIYTMRCLEEGEYNYYYVKPVQMENWESTGSISFELADSKDFVGLGTVGNIVVNREEKTNVMCLPKDAIHQTDSNQFVYVLEDGIRKMKYIKTGLTCNGKTEIISGLTDKENVIMEQAIEEETSSTEQGEGAEDEK